MSTVTTNIRTSGSLRDTSVDYSLTKGFTSKDYPPIVNFQFLPRGGTSGDTAQSPVITNYSYDRQWKQVTSVASPGLKSKKRLRLGWIKRKIPHRPPPLKPFYPPVLPTYKPIIFKRKLLEPVFKVPKNTYEGKNASFKWKAAMDRADARYQRQMKRFKSRLATRIQIISKQRSDFELRYSKAVKNRISYIKKYEKRKLIYQSRLERYIRLLDRYVNPEYKFVRDLGDMYKIRNPYTMIKERDYGISGNMRQFSCNGSRTVYNTTDKFAVLSNWCDSSREYVYENVPFFSVFSSLQNSIDSNSKVTSSAEAKARKQLLSKISDKASLGLCAVEVHKTIDLIRELVSRLVSFKRDPFSFIKYFANDSKALSNDFLALNFGIKPLVEDLYKTVEVLKDSDLQKISLIYRSTGACIDSISSLVGQNGSLKTSIVLQKKVKICYSLEYEVSSPIGLFSSNLGLTNPAYIAWDAVPFSFIVDWIYPIGSFLSSLDAEYGLNFVGGTKTTITEYVHAGFRTGRTQDGMGGIYVGELSGIFERVEMNRTVLQTAPSFFFAPSTKLPFSTTHILESLALLRQRS